MHYLDNAATTPVNKSVADVANDTLRSVFANPSALYALGLESTDVIENARKEVAQALGCLQSEIIFTACGTEGNNIAVNGACIARKGWANHIVATGFEHPSVYKVCMALQNNGFNTTFVKPDENGSIDSEKMLKAITNKTALLTVMHVNNEIGSIQEIEFLAKKAKRINSRIAVHVDGVQGFGKLQVDLKNTCIDSYAISGHKAYAPKGVGALYLRKNYNIAPVYFGGKQEKNMRPGTENIAYIAALGKAAQLIYNNEFYPKQLKSTLLNGLKNIGGCTVNSPENAHPSIVNFSTNCVKSEVMLHFLESKQIYVSAGSACSKGATSHTLAAMHLDKKRTDTALRVSFGRQNTIEDVEKLVAAIKEGTETLARI